MNIVALFIVGPARHDGFISTSDHVGFARDEEFLLSGIHVVRFLNGIRDQTADTRLDR